jgi:hypothetical protein
MGFERDFVNCMSDTDNRRAVKNCFVYFEQMSDDQLKALCEDLELARAEIIVGKSFPHMHLDHAGMFEAMKKFVRGYINGRRIWRRRKEVERWECQDCKEKQDRRAQEAVNEILETHNQKKENGPIL